MTDLLRGPRSLSPWLEDAVVEYLREDLGGPKRPTRIAHILRCVKRRNHGLLTDGHVTILVRLDDDDDDENNELPSGIVRLLDWRFVAEHPQQQQQNEDDDCTRFGVYNQKVTILLHVAEMEHVGSVMPTTKIPPAVLQLPEVLRHLQHIEQTNLMPVGNVSELVAQDDDAIDELVEIVEDIGQDNLTVGNIAAVLGQQDTEMLDALIPGAATTTSSEEEDDDDDDDESPKAATTEKFLSNNTSDFTMESESEASGQAASPQKGIQDMLLDDDDDPLSPPSVTQKRIQAKLFDIDHEEEKEQHQQQAAKESNNNAPSLLRPSLSRDDSRATVPHSNNSKRRRKTIQASDQQKRRPMDLSFPRITVAPTQTSLTAAGDRLRKLFLHPQPPIHFAKPNVSASEVDYAGDPIRLWLLDWENV